MNAYELADELEQNYFSLDREILPDAAVMLRDLQILLDEYKELNKNKADRIAELEKGCTLCYEAGKLVGKNHSAKQLSDEDLDKLVKDAQQNGYMDLYIDGLIDGFNRARAIIKEMNK